MTTFQVITRPNETVRRTTDADDSIETEMLFSTREAGIACFPFPGDEFEEDGDD
jgi:hypothetical protein